MVSREEDKEGGFLSRWSQRKQAERSHEEAAAESDGAANLTESPSAPEKGQASEVEEVRPEDLPDIDSLDATSDFSAFMKRGVPDSLKQRALKKLWHVDPAFKHICMLDDYNLDYTDAAMVVPNMKTLYQVGKGMVLPQAEPAEDAVAEGEGGALEAADQAALSGDSASGDQVSQLETAEAEDLPDDDAAVQNIPDAAAPLAPQDTNPADKPRRARNPGDPVITTTAAQRRSTPRAAGRSALNRRWGGGDS